MKLYSFQPSPFGKSVKNGFRSTADQAGLDDVLGHTLRYTAATWLMRAGIACGLPLVDELWKDNCVSIACTKLETSLAVQCARNTAGRAIEFMKTICSDGIARVAYAAT